MVGIHPTASEAGSRPDDLVGGGIPKENDKAVVVSHTGFPWSGAMSESHNIYGLGVIGNMTVSKTVRYGFESQ